MSIQITVTPKGAEEGKKLFAESFPETVAQIGEIAKAATAEAPIAIDVSIPAGSYPFEKPLVLDAEENEGLRYVSLSMTGEGGMAAISGTRALSLADFNKAKDGDYYVYRFAKGEDGYPAFEDFYVDGRRVKQARGATFVNPLNFPNKDKTDPVNHIGLYLPEEALAPFRGMESLSPVRLDMYVEWHFYSLEVDSIDWSDTCEVDGARLVRARFKDDLMFQMNNFVNGFLTLARREVYFINHPALLTPGTFTYNVYTGELCYMPAEGTLDGHEYAVSLVDNLLTVKGMQNLAFRNLSFTGATSGYRVKNSYFSGQANCEKRVRRLAHAALITYNVRRVLFDGCAFEELGANGLLMKDSSTAVTVKNCRFKNIGMSALSIGNPEKDWSLTANRNIGITVENNLFEDIAYSYPTALAVYIGMVDRLKLMHNTIRRCAYSAISVGWGWSSVGYSLGERVNVRDAEIAYNYIEDFMMLLRDGAAIYVLGANCTWDNERRFNSMHHNYAVRELYKDTSKRGYYMDGSSSNWEVYENAISGVRLPIFSQFHCAGQYTHHNYIHDIYTDYPVDRGNHAPWRDTVIERIHDDARSEAELLEMYPEVVSIRNGAGCRLED